MKIIQNDYSGKGDCPSWPVPRTRVATMHSIVGVNNKTRIMKITRNIIAKSPHAQTWAKASDCEAAKRTRVAITMTALRMVIGANDKEKPE